MKKLQKIGLSILFVLVGGFVVLLVSAFVVYPSEYVLRVLRWGNSDVYDYQKFPERPMPASDNPFFFEEAYDGATVQALFESQEAVDDLDAFLERNQTQAFIVIQDDKILYEKYYNGADRETIVTSFSVAKSFGSALVGIAIEEGYINSVDDPIIDYLPELAERDPAFSRITIRNLLMMSSGIRYKELPHPSNDDAKTYYYPDLRTLALDKTKIVGKPGETFLYNNYHPLLLGMILERATGTAVTDYLAQKIWQPMGTEFDASWSLDTVGFEKMESGINARAIDFAKFGRLYLHNGNWNGTQLIPAAWVAESTQADQSVDYLNYYGDSFIFANGQGYYKYMWWGMQRNADMHDFMALGNHGQTIYVSPHKNLIIVRNGETFGEFGGAQGWVDMFYQFAGDIGE